MKNLRILFVNILLIVLLASCQAGNHAANSASEALMSADTAFSTLSEKQGLTAAFRQYAASDSPLLPENQAAITGKGAILGNLKAMPAGSTLSWSPQAAEASGDLGYSWGIYTLTGKNSEGQATAAYGKYLSVWKRREGQWRLLVMMVNSTPGPTSG